MNLVLTGPCRGIAGVLVCKMNKVNFAQVPKTSVQTDHIVLSWLCPAGFQGKKKKRNKRSEIQGKKEKKGSKNRKGEKPPSADSFLFNPSPHCRKSLCGRGDQRSVIDSNRFQEAVDCSKLRASVGGAPRGRGREIIGDLEPQHALGSLISQI